MQGKYPKNISRSLKEKKKQFSVKGRHDPDKEYCVDMALGTGARICASDGSPCSQQLVVAIH